MNIFVKFFETLGRISIFLYNVVSSIFAARKTLKLTLQQIFFLGYMSFPIVVITSIALGMVSAVQTAYQLRDLISLTFLGAGIAKGIMIELGPMLTALVVGGRISAGIAAELGTMKITEQIDALECMGINPYSYLVLPRVLAVFISLPLLTVVSEFLSILSAGLITKVMFAVPLKVFFRNVKIYFLPLDLWGGLLKTLFFSLIISLVGCYWGFNAGGGAVGVGKATTQAVVTTSILLLVADYILGSIIFATV